MESWGVAAGLAAICLLIGLWVGRHLSSKRKADNEAIRGTRYRSRIHELEMERDELLTQLENTQQVLHDESRGSGGKAAEEELAMERAAHESTLEELEEVRGLLEQYRESSIPGPPVAPSNEPGEVSSVSSKETEREDSASTSQKLRQIKKSLGDRLADKREKKEVQGARDTSGARDSAPFGDGALFTQAIRPTRITPDRKRFARVDVFVKEHGALLPADQVEGFITSQGGREMMDRWVVRSVVKTISLFSTDARKQIQGFLIPISARSVGGTEAVPYIREQLSRFDVEGAQLIFELPIEMVRNDPRKAESFTQGVRALGCFTALGELDPSTSLEVAAVGFDYACLSKNVAVGINDKSEISALEGFVALAASKDLGTIAWGVESREVFQVLKDAGVDFVQGDWVEGPVQLREMGRKTS